ncbi:unnamed protein product [Peniophora sp. CBMAI 1063]|nr:unnamed protein product [Peniophora sp. CBMAI 1063]
MDQQPGATEEQAAVPPEEPLDTTLPTSESSEVNDVDAAKRAYASYKQTWDISHLETAIALFQRAADSAPVPTSSLLGSLGKCLYLYYRARGNLDNLQRAIAAEQRALQLVPEGHPDRAFHLSNLSFSLKKRFQSLGTVEDLKSAIEMQHDAVELTPDGHPSLSVRLDNLGGLQELRSRRFGNLEDLESAIASQQRATELTPDDHPDKATLLNNLAGSSRRRFERLNDPADLERAITIQRRAVELTPHDYPHLPVHLGNLGDLQLLRFRRFGKLEDLESAIAGHQRATELTPDDHPDKATRLNNLAFSLQNRFQRLDDPADLERAIIIQRRAVKLTPDDHPTLPASLDNLGGSHLLRFERFGKLEDLESAIANQQRATNLIPDDHPDKGTGLHNLATSMCSRFERLDDPADLERAITIQRRAVELTPNDEPHLPGRLANLGSLQHRRFQRFGRPEDLKSAIVDHRRAVSLTVDNQSAKALRLHNLALTLVDDFRRERTTNRFTDALSCFMAASQSLASPAKRLCTVTYTLKFLDENPEFSTAEMLLSAHSRILHVLSELVWLGHTMERRLEESQKLGQLASSAVSTSIGVNALEQAVEWLDAGRGLIWTQTMSLRDPLHELERIRPDLARALADVHIQLQRTIHSSFPPRAMSITEIRGNSEADWHRGLAIEYGNLITEIRRHPGLGDFMRPPKLSTILPLCTSLHGTVVFLNIDQSRCDALTLTPDGTIHPIPLPKLSLEKAERIRSQWVTYLQQRNIRQRMATCINRCSDSTLPVIRILGRLWRWIVLPVLSALRITNLPREGRLPHITWCPTGPLTQLPIHAAGIYDEEFGPHTYDYVVSSYTPSLSTLTRSIGALAQQRASSPSGIVVVTQPATPGLPALPGTTLEGKRLQEVFNDGPNAISVLNGEQATIATVKEALRERPWLHLACHGSQDLTDPLKSAFSLHDGPLSLLDLMNTTADDAGLAFLSACQTAVGDEKIPEESMHLAAGMLAVGYKGVIATMWSIQDDDAPSIVEAYYKKLLELRAAGTLGAGETGAAYALHEAGKRLREKVGEKNVVRWAPFVHFGI